MMKRISTKLFAIILLSCINAFSQEINFSGKLNTIWGMKAPGIEGAGDLTVGKTDFTGTVEAYAGDSSLLVEGTVGYDSILGDFNYDFDEAYIDYTTSFWGIRIGRQKTAWGKADGIDITNSVFPEDCSSLYLDDEKLGVNALRLSLTGNLFTIDGFWIPFFRGNKLPLEEKNPLRKILIPSKAGTFPVTLGKIQEPELQIQNGEYGIKASGYFPLCDISLYGFYGWDKTPLMNYSLSASGISVNGEYKRMTMFGLDAAFPAGATVLRFETAFFPERSVQASANYILQGNKNYITQNELMALAGIDWMPDEWTLTAQYYCDVLLNKSSNTNRADTYDHGVTLSISRKLLSETLELSFSGILELIYFDSALEFYADYSLSDQIGLKLGTYVFLEGPEGKANTYGKYKDFSTIYFSAQYKF